jgi:hypothetical protein
MIKTWRAVTVAERFHFVHIQPKPGKLNAERRPVSQSFLPPHIYIVRKPVWEDSVPGPNLPNEHRLVWIAYKDIKFGSANERIVKIRLVRRKGGIAVDDGDIYLIGELRPLWGSQNCIQCCPATFKSVMNLRISSAGNVAGSVVKSL